MTPLRHRMIFRAHLRLQIGNGAQAIFEAVDAVDPGVARS
jgi:hypothetical protein